MRGLTIELTIRLTMWLTIISARFSKKTLMHSSTEDEPNKHRKYKRLFSIIVFGFNRPQVLL